MNEEFRNSLKRNLCLLVRLKWQRGAEKQRSRGQTERYRTPSDARQICWPGWQSSHCNSRAILPRKAAVTPRDTEADNECGNMRWLGVVSVTLTLLRVQGRAQEYCSLEGHSAHRPRAEKPRTINILWDLLSPICHQQQWHRYDTERGLRGRTLQIIVDFSPGQQCLSLKVTQFMSGREVEC